MRGRVLSAGRTCVIGSDKGLDSKGTPEGA